MARGGHRKPVKRSKNFKKDVKDEARALQRAKRREKQSRKSKSLTRQMRGMKWDEEEYGEDFEEKLEDE